jgi:hypothetical protein
LRKHFENSSSATVYRGAVIPRAALCLHISLHEADESQEYHFFHAKIEQPQSFHAHSWSYHRRCSQIVGVTPAIFSIGQMVPGKAVALIHIGRAVFSFFLSLSLCHFHLHVLPRIVLVRSMDFSNSQCITALQEAFSCYLACLSYAQQLRASKLPRQGKDAETTADLSVEKDFQVRISVAEAGLNYAEKIAGGMRRWVKIEPEDETDEDASPSVDVGSFEALLTKDTGKSFVDILSGAWIEPATPFSAGPSNTKSDSESEDDCVYHKPKHMVTDPNLNYHDIR